ncbi:MAG: chromosome segregation protein SMC [Verrucomicrobia bacterium]|nr:chromosome segregation protein SMC [Verrucomicrobiota bacterium]
MILKSLDIHGFKSFADRTKLEFHEGVTGIVGPNGCGKSNVVDAIRWVLGETSAKALRGGEMADVIFNGTEKREQVGMAEVLLTLSGCGEKLNTEFDEVSIGRRVFRDGKSEYLLNKRPCRLKDITEMLMDTGIGRTSYSIMEQGKIDMLLSSKPEDRRAVFEEAAGITKFKAQKKEALRKLDYTEANLVRLTDIIAEVERQMRSLQRQSSKARRFKTLHTDLKVLDLHLSHRTWREHQAERSELDISINSLRETQSTLEIEIETSQQGLTSIRNEYQGIESRIGDTQRAMAEQQNAIQSAQNRIEFNAERARELKTLIEQNTSDIESTTSKLSQQELDLKDTDNMLQAIDEKIAKQLSQVSDYETAAKKSRDERYTISETLSKTRDTRNSLESKLASLEARIENNTKHLAADQQRFIQLDEEIQRLVKEEQTKTAEVEVLTGGAAEHQKAIQEMEEHLKNADHEYQKSRTELEELRQQLASLHRTHSEKVSRLDVLRQLVAEGEGLAKGTQSVLKGLDQPELFQSSVRGSLTSFFEVDSKYIPAIEAAMGNHLQTVIVTDTLMAENMIEALKKGQLGQASLAAEDSASQTEDSQILAIPDGATSWALDRIKCNEKIAGLVNRLLENVLIVPDLATALRLREEMGASTAFTTLAGEFISKEGIINGGAGTEEGSSLLQRESDIRELSTLTQQLEQELAAAEKQASDLTHNVADLETTVQSARAKLQQKQVQYSTFEGQLTMMQRELQQVENKAETLRWEQTEVAQRQDETDEELQTANKDKTETANKLSEFGNDLDELKSQLQLAEIKETEATESLGEVRTALAVEKRAREAVENQRSPMTSRLVELQELLDRRKNEIGGYEGKINSATGNTDELHQQIKDSTEAAAKLTTTLDSIREERSEKSTAIDKTEADLAQKRKQTNQMSEQRTNEEIASTQIDLRIENLANTTRERYQIDIDRFEPDSHALLNAIEDQRKSMDRSAKRKASDETVDSESIDEPATAIEEEPVDEEEIATEAVDIPDESEPDWSFVEEVVGFLRGKLESIGPVNMDAIDEFDELQERFTFLQTQNEDLNNAKEELMNVITKINRDTKKMFAETFEQIRKNFSEMFIELFGKTAKADLILADESDPLESGIDIIAKPPGKKLQTISLLSGGERSMTAVALLFAIYMVKPSPFCVLDELDAPLDEANIGRFLKVLDRFIDNSQFIIVTHNKRTMSRADLIYGVSMEEYGVSKTLGMQFTSNKTESSELEKVES